MNKLLLGVLLILMMFGHNYVTNQPQVLQQQLQKKHQITVPQFNLLYSLPSAIAIFFILPLGVLYDKYAQLILIGSGFFLMFGQFLVSLFGYSQKPYAFPLLTAGRVLQGTSAEVLYMIQANLSSTWMGKLAGLTLILPEIGEIANVFLTIQIKQLLGVPFSLYIGFGTCFLSFIACIFVYRQIKRHKKIHSGQNYIMVHSPQTQDQEKDLRMIEQQTTQKQSQSQQHAEQCNNSSKQKKAGIDLNMNQKICPEKSEAEPSIFKAGSVFWLVIVICAINQCLYFPFLDNAKVLIQTRFCIQQQKTSFYLCLPYLSAITLSILVGQHILYRFPRHILIFFSTLLPLIGHTIIYLLTDCVSETTVVEEIFLILGFVFFGSGIAGYYSISMPAVGLSVPQSIRGTAFACLGFFQTLTMTAVPLISGFIIEEDSSNNDDYEQGYRNSSFFFVSLCISASIIGFIIMKKAKPDSFKYVEQYQESSSANIQELNQVSIVSGSS